MAAKRGNAAAQNNLANSYYRGTCGLTQSSKKSIEYYTLAAKQGNASAQSNLGVMYVSGDGIGTPGEPLTFATLVWTAAPWSDFLQWNGPGVYAVNATMSIFGASASSNQ